jgi:WD40 repeat protein
MYVKILWDMDALFNAAQPPVILTSIIRSAQSLRKYGPNTSILLRPDGEILVLQTQSGYLISYSLSVHPEHRPYDLILRNGERRRKSLDARSYATKRHDPLFDGGGLCPDASLRFRMVMKVDAGITKALALDAELVIVTRKPAAVQCIPWPSDQDAAQPVTELVEKMEWLEGKEGFVDVVYDRPMNLFTFSTVSGSVYAVQKIAGGRKSEQKPLYKGHRFYSPIPSDATAVKTAINSRFSVIAVGAADGTISLYTVRDYTGGVSLLSKLQPSISKNSTGALTSLVYSPDGYCLFAGYEHGWATWSVYGQPGGTSFSANAEYTKLSNDSWLDGVVDAFWTANGTDIVLLDNNGDQLWLLEFARSAISGCFTPANIARTMLQTNSGFMVYKGHSTPDLLTIAADISLWQHIKAPAAYLADQGPIRAAVTSSDGRYLAIAGQRGLAHYSFQSGRWRTFEDVGEQNSFAVRGGMCWHHHILIVATEAADGHEVCMLWA